MELGESVRRKLSVALYPHLIARKYLSSAIVTDFQYVTRTRYFIKETIIM